MGVEIKYPPSKAQWYAKGTFADGTRFEVPAVFSADGSCDTEATDAKVAQLQQVLALQARGEG